MGGVQTDAVHLRAHQRGHAIHGVGGHAHRRAAQQAAAGIAGRVGILGALLDVLDGDESAKIVILIHDGELLDAMLGQNLLGRLQIGAHGRGDEVVLRHHVLDRLVEVGFEAEVAVGQNTHQLAVLGDRHAGDAIAGHELLRVADLVLGREKERIGDDAVFAALDLVGHGRLRLDAHVLVDDAQAALARDGNRHRGIGDRVHGRAQHRNVQLQILRQLNRQIHLARKHIASLGNEKYVVKSKTFADNRQLQHPLSSN